MISARHPEADIIAAMPGEGGRLIAMSASETDRRIKPADPRPSL